MIVWFPTTEARDVVKSAAKNLAVLVQDYGVRLEVPNHLKTNIQALQTVSYDIKQNHPTARRNLLFDDGVMDPALDFCTGDRQPWRTVSARQARQAKAKRKRKAGESERDIDDGELEKILGGRSGGTGNVGSDDE